MGSTFERNVTELPASAPDQLAAHQGQWNKLQTLMPTAARPWRPFRGPAGGWRAGRWRGRPGGTLGRRALHRPDRLPIVGPVDAATLPGLWVCTAMGARGLTLAPAVRRTAGRPPERRTLPLDAKLARALASERM